MEIKISKNSKQDILKFQKITEDRNICIRQGSSDAISTQYSVNHLASRLHPDRFEVRVREIILENEEVKTFVFEKISKEQPFLVHFQPGQYVTLEVPFQDGFYQRAYSISCSPSYLKKGMFQVTIKKIPNGKVSTYFFDEVKVGDTFVAHGPFGEFCYQSIRDSSHVVAIVNGSGIAPILSMAESIFDGICHYQLIILYEALNEKDILFQNKLEQFAKHKNIEVIYFLKNEEKELYRTGSVTKEVLEEVSPVNASYFVCGSLSLYDRMNTIFKEMHVPNKFIRHDAYMDYKKNYGTEVFQVTILTSRDKKVISCSSRETLMDAMEREGIRTLKKCGVGVCGFCQSKLIEGEVVTDYEHMKKSEIDFHYIHPCATYPMSDVTIQLPF